MRSAEFSHTPFTWRHVVLAFNRLLSMSTSKSMSMNKSGED